LFIETIQILNGTLISPELHEQRFNYTYGQHYPSSDIPAMRERVEYFNPKLQGTIKCVVYYHTDIYRIDFIPYRKKLIESLKLVICDELEYSFKFADRSTLNRCFDKRENCDEVIIVKNGLVSDASYANLAFKSGEEWFTPGNPILSGTKRKLLINRGLLKEREIRPADISQYSEVCLINAMLDLEDISVPVEQIF